MRNLTGKGEEWGTLGVRVGVPSLQAPVSTPELCMMVLVSLVRKHMDTLPKSADVKLQ